MKLSSILQENHVKILDKANSKNEVISILLDSIFKNRQIHLNKEEVFSLINEREKLGGTIFENGMAIPHARLENFNDLFIGIAILSNPIIESGIPIKFVVLSIISKSASNTYLRTLSAFAQISQNKELFEKVASSKSHSDFFSAIENIKIKSKDVLKVSPETTLKELCDIFYKHNISYIPVVDDNDDFIGEVTITEVLKVGIPNYALMIGNLKFLSSFEPFEELLKNEDKIKVKEIMRKPSFKLPENSSIIEVALEITQNNKRQLPVVEGDKIIGIVSYMDLLKKVLRV